jgi:hypothetical protein
MVELPTLAAETTIAFETIRRRILVDNKNKLW